MANKFENDLKSKLAELEELLTKAEVSSYVFLFPNGPASRIGASFSIMIGHVPRRAIVNKILDGFENEIHKARDQANSLWHQFYPEGMNR